MEKQLIVESFSNKPCPDCGSDMIHQDMEEKIHFFCENLSCDFQVTASLEMFSFVKGMNLHPAR